MPLLVARLALASPLRVLDGGNSFNFLRVARSLRRKTAQVEEKMAHIYVARAFTCYQVLSLLEQTPDDGTPVLGLELLTTFYDESVHRQERRRLLEKSLAHLLRLSRSAPVAVSSGSQNPDDSDEWQALLEEQASQVWRLKNNPGPTAVRLL